MSLNDISGSRQASDDIIRLADDDDLGVDLHD